jgi:hypothetical protein
MTIVGSRPLSETIWPQLVFYTEDSTMIIVDLQFQEAVVDDTSIQGGRGRKGRKKSFKNTATVVGRADAVGRNTDAYVEFEVNTVEGEGSSAYVFAEAISSTRRFARG